MCTFCVCIYIYMCVCVCVCVCGWVGARASSTAELSLCLFQSYVRVVVDKELL